MIRVLLADDHTIVRDGLRALLEREADIEVVGEAADGRAAVRLAREQQPEVVVMDVAMPELNGIEATRQVVAETPCRVVALSMHSDRQFVAEMLRAGAFGYLLKGAATDEVVTAIRTVAGGRHYLSAGIAGIVVSDYVRHLAGDTTVEAELTPRQAEVLQLLAEGKRTREIAEALHVSVKTIETYRSQIMDKLDLRSVAELTKYAIRRGLTDLDA